MHSKAPLEPAGLWLSTRQTCILCVGEQVAMASWEGGKYLKRLLKLGGYKSEASTFGKVPSNSRCFLVTVTPSLLGCCYSCRMLWRAQDGDTQQQGQQNCCTHPWQHNQLPLATEPVGARRGHFTPRQDIAEKIISRGIFCISKVIASFLSVCLTSALALEGVI